MKLKEIVPYNKSADIEKGLVAKHGYANFNPGTFGIEIEFTPTDGQEEEDIAGKILEEVDSDTIADIIERYGQSRQFESDYVDWVYEQRRSNNRRTWGRGWDDTYGPPDEDEWVDMNPEPDTARDEDGNITDEYSDWVSNKKDAIWNYSRWERDGINEYKSNFVSDLRGDIFNYIDIQNMIDVIRSRYARQYPGFADVKEIVARENIRTVQTYLVDTLNQKIGEWPTETTWEVGKDGDNVEIRSRHLKKEDFSVVENLFSFLDDQGYDMNSETSAHVHVGLPEGFDKFSLLALMSLVDEKTIKNEVGKRNLAGWAKLRDTFEAKVSTKIDQLLKQHNQKSLRFSEEKLDDLIKNTAEKFSGTNIRSFYSHHTVEFRYFGSNVKDITKFLRWIEYFMLLPVIASKRREVKIGNVYFRKMEDGTVVATTDRNIKVEPYQGNKYLDKLKAKRQASEPVKI